MIKQIIVFLVVLALLPCDKVIKRIVYSKPSVVLTPKINELLEEAIKTKTVEFNNAYQFDYVDKFLFFKSGHILDSLELNAITNNGQADTTFSIKLYSLKNLRWQMLDSISNLKDFPWRFDISFNDYNFDGQVDIYIQIAVSNGWGYSYGYIILIDPKTKKLELHKEAIDFGNMSIDPYSKTIFSEEWQGYDSLSQPHFSTLSNKWINGQLKTIDNSDTTSKY
jgi:hypothetical protein